MAAKTNHFIEDPAMVQSLAHAGFTGKYTFINPDKGWKQFRATRQDYVKRILSGLRQGDRIPAPVATPEGTIIGSHRTQAWNMYRPGEKLYAFVLTTTPSESDLHQWDFVWNTKGNGLTTTNAERETMALDMISRGVPQKIIVRDTLLSSAQVSKLRRNEAFRTDLSRYYPHHNEIPALTVPQFNALAERTGTLSREVKVEMADLTSKANLTITEIQALSTRVHATSSVNEQLDVMTKARAEYRDRELKVQRGEWGQRTWYSGLVMHYGAISSAISRQHDLPDDALSTLREQVSDWAHALDV